MGRNKCPQEDNTPGGTVVQMPGGSITEVQKELEFMTGTGAGSVLSA